MIGRPVALVLALAAGPTAADPRWAKRTEYVTDFNEVFILFDDGVPFTLVSKLKKHFILEGPEDVWVTYRHDIIRLNMDCSIKAFRWGKGEFEQKSDGFTLGFAYGHRVHFPDQHLPDALTKQCSRG